VVLTILIKKGLVKWAWIPALPLIWDLMVTMTASWQKIFSADPKLGYWTQHNDYSTARDAGKLLAPAKTVDDMDKIVRNTFIQGSLSIIFAVLVLIVAIVGVVVCLRAWRADGGPSSESPEEPSKIFAPRGFIATPAEKEVQKEWDALIEAGKVRAPGAAHARGADMTETPVH
jgi:carbon starvation protein